MQCNILSQQVGQLDGKVVYLHSNFTGDVCVVNNGKLTKYSSI